jgi:TolB-like protein
VGGCRDSAAVLQRIPLQLGESVWRRRCQNGRSTDPGSRPAFTLQSRQAPLPDLPLHVAPTRPLVAVMPFQGGGDNPTLRLLGEEIADLLRERLERDPAVQAILISSDFLAKAPPHAVELVCRELRVGYLITGKCHQGAREPSLYVELTDTRDWHIRWAHFYRESARALLADSGDAMTELVSTLRRSLVERPPR